MQLALLTGADAVVATTVEFIQLVWLLSLSPFLCLSILSIPALTSLLFILLNFWCMSDQVYTLFPPASAFFFGLPFCFLNIWTPLHY